LRRRRTRRYGGGSLNNSFNLQPENLENLHVVNINTPEWTPTVGNKASNEKIPESLQWRPRVPKMMLPFALRKQQAAPLNNNAVAIPNTNRNRKMSRRRLRK
jgi:hypothetical protein